MKFFIDSADPEEIRRCLDFYPVDGVTMQSKLEPKKIRCLVGDDCGLHIPLESLRAADMVDEARKIVAQSGVNTCVGIRFCDEGLRAMKLLGDSEVSFAATDVRTSMQALIAGKCGASYVVPFVNRLDNRNAVLVVEKMSAALKNNRLETEILAVRFKTARQAVELAEYGIDAVSVPMRMLSAFVVDGF